MTKITSKGLGKKLLVQKTYLIRAISSNLIQALSERAESDNKITLRYGVVCRNRAGDYIKEDLWEVPHHVYLEIYTRKYDYHFAVFLKNTTDGSEGIPREIFINVSRPRDDFKIARRARNGVIRATSLLRKHQRLEVKLKNQGVH